jgi:multidrug efflux pump subunit AcrB
MPEGTTLERIRTVTNRTIAWLDRHETVKYVQNVTGSSPRVGTNQGRATLTVILKPWKERNKSIDEVIRDAREEFYNYPEIRAFISRPAAIPGLGEAGGVEMKLPGTIRRRLGRSCGRFRFVYPSCKPGQADCQCIIVAPVRNSAI